jgi:hypothetical protein
VLSTILRKKKEKKRKEIEMQSEEMQNKEFSVPSRNMSQMSWQKQWPHSHHVAMPLALEDLKE